MADNALDFLFTTTGGLTTPFNLDHVSDGTLAITQTFASDQDGTYTVTEPIFWRLTLDNLIFLDPDLMKRGGRKVRHASSRCW